LICGDIADISECDIDVNGTLMTQMYMIVADFN